MSDVPAIPEKNTFKLLALLEEAGAVINNGLFLPPGLEYDKYEALCALLGAHHHMNAFLIGDAILYGEHEYGEKYAQASERFGLAPQTLANYTSGAKRVPPSRRRVKDGVSFSHHMEVAALSPNEQRHWLKIVVDERLSKQELRDRLHPRELPPAGEAGVCPSCGRSYV